MLSIILGALALNSITGVAVVQCGWVYIRARSGGRLYGGIDIGWIAPRNALIGAAVYGVVGLAVSIPLGLAFGGDK